MYSGLVILLRDTVVSDINLNLPAGCNIETDAPVSRGPSGDVQHVERAVGGVWAHQDQQLVVEDQLVISQH